jgi:hypothetical protein
MKHRPELDGLRGAAILVVLGAHTGVPGFASGGGGAGVTLFFVLSGYLITSLLLAEKASSGRVSTFARSTFGGRSGCSRRWQPYSSWLRLCSSPASSRVEATVRHRLRHRVHVA